MADAFDKYRRTLTVAEKAAFIVACRDDGVDPKVQCPFCRTTDRRRIKTEPRYRYCETHKNWEGMSVVGVACHNCEIQWSVRFGDDACRTMDGQLVDA